NALTLLAQRSGGVTGAAESAGGAIEVTAWTTGRELSGTVPERCARTVGLCAQKTFGGTARPGVKLKGDQFRDPRRDGRRHDGVERGVPQVVAVQRGRPAEPAGASRDVGVC